MSDSEVFKNAGWLTLGGLSQEVSRRSRRRVHHSSVASWLPTAIGHLKAMLVDHDLVDRPDNWTQRTLYHYSLVDVFIEYMDRRVFGKRVDVIALTRLTRATIDRQRAASAPVRTHLAIVPHQEATAS